MTYRDERRLCRRYWESPDCETRLTESFSTIEDSWEKDKIQTEDPRVYSTHLSSHITALRSRWFVGSSKSSKVGSINNALKKKQRSHSHKFSHSNRDAHLARETLIRQPPDRCFVGLSCICAVKPRPCKQVIKYFATLRGHALRLIFVWLSPRQNPLPWLPIHHKPNCKR